MGNRIFVKSKLPPYAGAVCSFCSGELTEDYYFNTSKFARKKYACPPCHETRMEQVMGYVQAWKDRQKEALGDPDGHLRSIMAESQ